MLRPGPLPRPRALLPLSLVVLLLLSAEVLGPAGAEGEDDLGVEGPGGKLLEEGPAVAPAARGELWLLLLPPGGPKGEGAPIAPLAGGGADIELGGAGGKEVPL